MFPAKRKPYTAFTNLKDLDLLVPMQFQPPVFDASNVAQSIAQRNELTFSFKSSNNNNTEKPKQEQLIRPLPRTLPPVSEVIANAHLYVGPTHESNWVILDRFMMGAYPASPDNDADNDMILRSILACGISTFVCLQLEYQHGVPEEMWRTGKCLRPYIEDAMEICHETQAESNGICRPHELKFLHHGIVDCGTTNDSTVLELAIDVCTRLLADEVIYLHCWGGHGRTGTVVAVALALMYGLDATEALLRTQLYHDLRVCNLNVPSPQTSAQRAQCERLIYDCFRTTKYSSVLPPLPMISNYHPTSPHSMPSPRFVKEISSRRPSLTWPGGV